MQNMWQNLLSYFKKLMAVKRNVVLIYQAQQTYNVQYTGVYSVQWVLE